MLHAPTTIHQMTISEKIISLISFVMRYDVMWCVCVFPHSFIFQRTFFSLVILSIELHTFQCVRLSFHYYYLFTFYLVVITCKTIRIYACCCCCCFCSKYGDDSRTKMVFLSMAYGCVLCVLCTYTISSSAFRRSTYKTYNLWIIRLPIRYIVFDIVFSIVGFCTVHHTWKYTCNPSDCFGAARACEEYCQWSFLDHHPAQCYIYLYPFGAKISEIIPLFLFKWEKCQHQQAFN